MNRRTALKLGAALAAGSTGIFAGYCFLQPAHSTSLESVDALSRGLYLSLDQDQRAETCVSYDHPLRQYHNRGVWGGGRPVFFGFTHDQRRILTDLLYAGLSEEGRQRIPDEYFAQWSGVNSLRVLICGDPSSGAYQVILTGTHLNLRLGGKSSQGAAFGGPQVYGDQRGDNQVGLPGNNYRDQFIAAQRLLRSLDPGMQKLALIENAPVQTGVELQGRHGSFPGIPVAELSAENQAAVKDVVERVLSTYAPDDVAYAQQCLAENGGTAGLYLSYYQQGEDGTIPEGQVFRLEGPGAVLYFRGFPHVHAFINIAMDGDSPLSVGDVLGTNPAWLDHDGVKALFETALRSQTGADLAFYPPGSVAGRLRPGQIRSGDIYSLESWQETSEVLDIRGANLSDRMIAQLRERNLPPDAGKTYKVATTVYNGDNTPEKLGSRIDKRTPGPMIRDAAIAYLQANGFHA